MAERIKLYTDEHVPRAVVKGLRERGVDMLTVAEAEMLGASDEEHLAFARLEGRVLFTQDKGFLDCTPRVRDRRGLCTRTSKQP